MNIQIQIIETGETIETNILSVYDMPYCWTAGNALKQISKKDYDRIRNGE
jgi:hypothetical protein